MSLRRKLALGFLLATGALVGLGAVSLYLNFINLFMFLLQFMGNRNN